MGIGDIFLGSVSILSALGIWLVSASYPVTENIARGLSPAAFPRFLAVIVGLAGATFLWQGIRTRSTAEQFDWSLLRQPGVFLALGAFYYVLMEPLGFLLATPAFLLAGAGVLGINLRKGLIFSAGLTGAAFGIFHSLLLVPLPVGTLWGG